ncbi:putative transporter [Trypanosoma grayi]|uniref:putative transporter n=1 Tax=Trypanosoma grayi TaxID=71804 RepID=UPI0004F3FB52|nr:putative transporter [Trypanosoma grayi]KEG15209.1 putative transporter [Trypanosoma grayi]
MSVPLPQGRPNVETPLPLKRMFALGIVLLNESLCATMLLPYVGLLVAHLQNRPPEESGYVSGLLIGVFMFGQVISSTYWGNLSDKYGRRMPLFVGLFTSGLLMLGFGLSTSVWMCVAFRFLHGLFNGNVLVAKTAVADILDKTNETKGCTLVSLTYGFGTLIGPAVGGLLYDPTNSTLMQWAGFSKDGPFAQYPGLLPAIVIFVYVNFGMVVCVLFVKESNPNAQPLPRWMTCYYSWMWPNRQYTVTSNDDGNWDGDGDSEMMAGRKGLGECEEQLREQALLNVDLKESSVEVVRSASSEGLPLLAPVACQQMKDGSTPDDEELEDLVVIGDEEEEMGGVEAVVAEQAVEEPFGYKEAFLLPATRNVLVIYMLLSAADMAHSEVFPLWAIAARSVGGLGYHSDMVGLFLLSNSVPCVVSNLLFHIACRIVGDKMRLWRIAIYGMAIGVGITPLASYIPRFGQFAVVLVCCFLRQWFAAWAYGLNTLLTARFAPSGRLGTMYGINQSCGAAMRCVIPVIITPIFAWSISGSHIPPFNHIFVFLLASIVFVMAGVISHSVTVDEDAATEIVVVEEAPADFNDAGSSKTSIPPHPQQQQRQLFDLDLEVRQEFKG